MGTLPKVHHIHVDPDIKPVVHPPRRVPIALHAKLKAELDRMESVGVIDRVTEPTDWVNSLVVVQKPNGQIRVCLDPKDLNKAIKRHHYQLPTAEDILSRMSGAKFFSKLDASSGYWQICVDKESSKLLTFNSPFGRYKFNRLPFGVHHASEVFQADVAEILEGIEGVQNAQDDIIIWGSTKAEHDQRLRDAMMQIRKSGMKLNKTKCVFSAREITFLGHTLTDVGIKPDLRKVTAITEMPNPQSKEDLRRFLGMVNYLAKFVPDLSDITAPLRELLEKDAQWCFEAAHENAIERLKSIITSEPVLKYFDPQLPTKVSTDASKSGLGATLEQKHGDKWCPVAFASRALTQAEYNYCPIEKETLSVLFGCEKFHEFVYGQLFEVENDHQPLKSIFNKPISKAPPRIQRFLLRLYRYDFTLNNTPGKNMVVSDALSRAYLKDQKPEISDAEMNYMIHSVISSLPISDEKLKQFQTETSKDETLRTLHKYVMNGWPKNKNDINPTSMPYFNIRDEISVANGLVLKGERIIVPLSMRKEMKQIIHSGNQGIEKCKARAREALYWPGMSAEIADIVSACSTCQEHRNYQQCEELLKHEVPREPWIKVGADLFTLKRKNYLLVVDYFSKFCEISLLADTSSPTIITNMKSIFARHGIPKLAVSDNQLDTKEFKNFQKEWDFNLTTSSPHYPKSNGMAERTVQTVKKLLKKALANDEDPYLALLAYRTTPGVNNTPSSAYCLMQRNSRTTLPSVKSSSKSRETDKSNQSHKIKKYHDQHACNLPDLQIGDTVRLRQKAFPKKLWNRKGKVLSKLEEPRSYKVETEQGIILRRNRRDLLKTKESFEPKPEGELDTCTPVDPELSTPNQENIPCQSPVEPLIPSHIPSPAPLQQLQPSPPPPETQQNSYRTRVGRRIVKPTRFKDYVTQ